MTKSTLEAAAVPGAETEVVLKRGFMRVQGSLDAILKTIEDSAIKGVIGGYYTARGFEQELSEDIAGIMLISNERYPGDRYNPERAIAGASMPVADENALFANLFLAHRHLEELKKTGFQYFYSIPPNVIKCYH